MRTMKDLLIVGTASFSLTACAAGGMFGTPEVGYITPQGIVINGPAFYASIERPQRQLSSRVYLKAVPPGTPAEFVAAKSVNVTSADFDQQGIALLHPRYYESQAEFTLATATGVPARVRSGAGSQAYTFCSPLFSTQMAKEATAHRVNSSRQLAEQMKQELQTAKTSLGSNRAYQAGVCKQVEQRPLPPRPEVLSQEAILLHSAGSAVDLAMRRFNSREVYEALLAVRMDAFIAAYEQWKKVNPEQCAISFSASQMDNWICNRVFRLAGPEAVYSCIQDLVKQYTEQAIRSCAEPMVSWKSKVDLIQNEPEKLLGDCQRDIETIRKVEERIPQLEMEAALNTEENAKLTSDLNASQLRIPLSQAVCHSGGQP